MFAMFLQVHRLYTAITASLQIAWFWQWQMLVPAKWLVTHLVVLMDHCQCHHLVAHSRKLTLVAQLVHLLRQ